MASERVKATKVEYISQSFAGQKIKVTLWPIFSEDVSGKNFATYTTQDKLENEWIGFGGDIKADAEPNSLISRAIFIYNQENKTAKL